MNSREKTYFVRLVGASLLLCVLIALHACSDNEDAINASPDTCNVPLDPALETLEGTVVLLDRYDDGHPRQLGIAIEPNSDTIWRVEGRELIWFAEGALARKLADHVGREVRVRGIIRIGHSLFLRAIALRSYELADEIALAPCPDPVVPLASIEGTIVVVDRHDDGHPHILGIAPDQGPPVIFKETNKSQELRYRIGRRMRVDGVFRAAQKLTVVSYAELDGSPLVEPGDGFRLCFLTGGLDVNGQFMGGVEIDAFAVFDGKIFAGSSYSFNTQEESPDPEPPGSQVLVLDSADGRWRVDLTEPGKAPKFKSLRVVCFETDHTGSRLDPPVEMLAAASGNGEVYLRMPGEPAQWFPTGIREVVQAVAGPKERPDARSVLSHTDPVTGLSYLFAGVGVGGKGDGGGIYRGTYDPSLPGLISWEPEAERPIPDASPKKNPRVMGMVEVKGTLYASVGPQLLRRHDGSAPSWTEVFYFPQLLPFRGDSIRRAAGLRGPDGGTSLLAGLEGIISGVARIDLDAGDASSLDLLLPCHFPGASYGIVAYNGPEIRTLEDGREVAILGIEINRFRKHLEPDPGEFDIGRFYEFTDGLFLWRDSDKAYRMNRIVDETLEVSPPLVAPRAILTRSPFPGEEDVLYFGGFDHNGHLFHNTGWIYKVHIDDLRSGLVPLPR